MFAEGLKTTQTTNEACLEQLLRGKKEQEELLANIDEDWAANIVSSQQIDILRSSKHLKTYIRASEGLKSVDIAIICTKKPSRDEPNPPCEIEEHTLYLVLDGDQTRVARMGYNVVDVWHTRDFGKLRLRDPHQEELQGEDFNPHTCLTNAVLKPGYQRVDPLTDIKLDATIAMYLRKVLEAAPEGTPIRLHQVNQESCLTEEVDEASVTNKEAPARQMCFYPLKHCTESIPRHFGLYEPDSKTLH